MIPQELLPGASEALGSGGAGATPTKVVSSRPAFRPRACTRRSLECTGICLESGCAGLALGGVRRCCVVRQSMLDAAALVDAMPAIAELLRLRLTPEIEVHQPEATLRAVLNRLVYQEFVWITRSAVLSTGSLVASLVRMRLSRAKPVKRRFESES